MSKPRLPNPCVYVNGGPGSKYHFVVIRVGGDYYPATEKVYTRPGHAVNAAKKLATALGLPYHEVNP